MYDRNVLQRVEQWWFAGLPPLSGPMRLMFYGGTLAMALWKNKSPITSIRNYRATDPDYVRFHGIFDFIGVEYIPQELLLGAAGVLMITWFFAAIGLFTRISMMMTAILAAFLHGAFLGVNVFNHNWFVAVYALAALAIMRPDDRWSIDGWWRRRRSRSKDGDGHATASRRATIADTGFGRQVLLVCVIGFYFGAGMTKLYVSGWQWMDGSTIAYFGEEHNRPVGQFMASLPWLCRMLAIFTLILELGGIFAPFSRWWKRIWLFGLAMMHIGIWISVGPRYVENIMCFALLIDWGRMRRDLPVWMGRFFNGIIQSTNATSTLSLESLPAMRRRLAVIGGTLVTGLMLSVGIGQIFWWPLTNVYMYCGYFSHEKAIRGNFPLADFEDPAKVQQIARHAIEQGWPREATEYLAFRVQLRFVGDGLEPRYKGEPLGLTGRKQWILSLVHPAVIADFAAKPPGRIAFDPQDRAYPAQRFLEASLPALRRHAPPWYEDFNRVELVYECGENEFVAIASAPLWPQTGGPQDTSAGAPDHSGLTGE